MIDFAAAREQGIPFEELVAGLTQADLTALTNEMIDTILDCIHGFTDADVTFQPVDPAADDPYAANAADANLAWTLGHVIVHVTASSEESAFLAAEMARGVENHGRSRSEVPWETVTTIAQCRQRLEESRRMRLASLELWPAAPYLELTYQPWSKGPQVNAVGRFVLGLRHEHSHIAQICEIARQVEAARLPA